MYLNKTIKVLAILPRKVLTYLLYTGTHSDWHISIFKIHHFSPFRLFRALCYYLCFSFSIKFANAFAWFALIHCIIQEHIVSKKMFIYFSFIFHLKYKIMYLRKQLKNIKLYEIFVFHIHVSVNSTLSLHFWPFQNHGAITLFQRKSS